MISSNLASPAPTPAADPTGPHMTPLGTGTAGTADTEPTTGTPGRDEPPGIARLGIRHGGNRTPTNDARDDDAAPGDSPAVLRVDQETRWDGDGWYTRRQFLAWYGDRGDDEWARAAGEDEQSPLADAIAKLAEASPTGASP